MYDQLEKISMAEQAEEKKCVHTFHVCTASSCLFLHSDKVLTALEQQIDSQAAGHRCRVKSVGCMGLCSGGPLVSVSHGNEPQNRTVYKKVAPEHAPALVKAAGEQDIVAPLVCSTDVPFFQRQKKIVLENCGNINPERIEEYVSAGGYRALLDVLTKMAPGGVIDEVVRSGLRGRGGGGYPTGLKWRAVAKAAAHKSKYVICNGDEGDPGAFMDRSVLESDPHRVIEGMIIAGYAVGAREGYMYIRGEYPLAVDRLNKAIHQARRLGILGDRVCGTTFGFNIDIRIGAGAYVCGEETALIASIEGRRGTPRPRPPFPAEYGLWKEPTLINNVETFANIAPIIRNGSSWYAAIGTEKSPGTKVFALAGSITNSGVIEVPMGISFQEIISDIGGGIPDGRRAKAVQTGGPSGGCIPAAHFATPVDYESLTALGSIMGSGGLLVMDETANMVDVARYFMDFCMTESCGKCVPCRVGTVHMVNLLEKIYHGRGSLRDLRALENLCRFVRETSLCGLGQSAPNPVLSTLRHYRHEYQQLLCPDDHHERADRAEPAP